MDPNFCLWPSGWLCQPLDWWTSAAAWAQAILTVATFFYAVNERKRRDRRDTIAQMEDRLDTMKDRVDDAKARNFAAEREHSRYVDELQVLKQSLATKVAKAQLLNLRLARDIRDRVEDALAFAPPTLAEKILCFEQFYIDFEERLRKSYLADALSADLGVVELAATIEDRADRIRRSQNSRGVLQEEVATRYCESLSKQLRAHLDWANGMISDYRDACERAAAENQEGPQLGQD